MMMTAIGMMVMMVDDGDGDQKQDQPGKLLGQGWGGEGAPSPAIMILALISNGFLCCFCVFHSFRFSVFVETYFS